MSVSENSKLKHLESHWKSFVRKSFESRSMLVRNILNKFYAGH